MSLMKTLAKVAIGVAVAKGANSMMKNRGGAQTAGGGLGGLLGGLAGSAGAGGLLGALGGAMGQRPASNNASFGDVLNSAFDQTPQDPIEPTADQEAAAALMLRAMIQAAKSDGKLDDGEQEKLMGQLGGDVDAEEAAFVRAEMQRPVDVNALVSDVPNGLGPQVYAMSLLAIDLDSQVEAKYLHSLAQGLGMDAASVNNVHAQLGVPSLYT